MCRAPGGLNVAAEPRKRIRELRPVRQHGDAVPEAAGADALEAAPRADPQRAVLPGQGVDEKKPVHPGHYLVLA